MTQAVGDMLEPATYRPPVATVDAVIMAAPHAVGGRLTRAALARVGYADGVMAGTLAAACLEHATRPVYTSDKGVAWEWVAQHFPVEGTSQTDEWVGTRVLFDIRANPDGSFTLVFTHHGLTPRVACYGQCNAEWNRFLESLTRYLEQGTGTPYSGAA